MRIVDGCDVFVANHIDNNNKTVMGYNQAVLKHCRDVTLINISVSCHRLESFNSF